MKGKGQIEKGRNWGERNNREIEIVKKLEKKNGEENLLVNRKRKKDKKIHF